MACARRVMKSVLCLPLQTFVIALRSIIDLPPPCRGTSDVTFCDGVPDGAGVAAAEALHLPLPLGLQLEHGALVFRPAAKSVNDLCHLAAVRHSSEEVAACWQEHAFMMQLELCFLSTAQACALQIESRIYQWTQERGVPSLRLMLTLQKKLSSAFALAKK